MFRYCAFCRTGSESAVADNIRRLCGGDESVKTLIPFRIINERKCGKWHEVRRPVYPGYIFIFSETPVPVHLFHDITYFFKMLRYSDGSCDLMGRDAEIAEWFYVNDGELAVSDVELVGKDIKVISGPLKDVCGCIQSVDRRKRRVSVKLDFADTPITITLGINVLEIL